MKKKGMVGKVLSHLKEDSKEFKDQMQDDKKLAKQLKAKKNGKK